MHLFHGALLWRLVRPPTQQPRAVAESSAAEMIVTNLDHQFWLKWFPFRGPFRRPAAGPARLVASEARGRDQLFELGSKRFFLFFLERRREANMVQQTLVIVEAEEQ